MTTHPTPEADAVAPVAQVHISSASIDLCPTSATRKLRETLGDGIHNLYARPAPTVATREPTIGDATAFNNRLNDIGIDEWPSDFEIHATLGYFGYVLAAPPTVRAGDEG